MMAEKARLFQDRRAEELIISSPDPRVHKRIGQGVRNFYKVIWDRVREDAVLAGTFAKFTEPDHETISSENWHQTLG